MAAVQDAQSQIGSPRLGFAAAELVASRIAQLIYADSVKVYPTAWNAIERTLRAIDQGEQCVIADDTLPVAMIEAAVDVTHHVVPTQDVSLGPIKRRIAVLKRQNYAGPLTLIVHAPFHAHRTGDYLRAIANACRSRGVYLIADVTDFLPMLGSTPPAGINGALGYCDAVVARLSPLFSSQASFVATRSDIIAAKLIAHGSGGPSGSGIALDEAAAVRTGLELLAGPHGEARRQMLERQRDRARSVLGASGFETSIVDLGRISYTLDVGDACSLESLPLLYANAQAYATTTHTSLTPISRTQVRVDIKINYNASKADVLVLKKTAVGVRDAVAG